MADPLQQGRELVQQLAALSQEIRGHRERLAELQQLQTAYGTHLYRARVNKHQGTELLTPLFRDFQRDEELVKQYAGFPSLVQEYEQARKSLSAVEQKCLELLPSYQQHLREVQQRGEQHLGALEAEQKAISRAYESVLAKLALSSESLLQLQSYAQEHGGEEFAVSSSLFLHRAACTAYAYSHQGVEELLFADEKGVQGETVEQTLKSLLLIQREKEAESFPERLKLNTTSFVLLAPAEGLQCKSGEEVRPLATSQSFYTQEFLWPEGRDRTVTRLLLYCPGRNESARARQDLAQFKALFNSVFPVQRWVEKLEREVDYLRQFVPEGRND